jgi:hypothetical protein
VLRRRRWRVCSNGVLRHLCFRDAGAQLWAQWGQGVSTHVRRAKTGHGRGCAALQWPSCGETLVWAAAEQPKQGTGMAALHYSGLAAVRPWCGQRRSADVRRSYPWDGLGAKTTGAKGGGGHGGAHIGSGSGRDGVQGVGVDGERRHRNGAWCLGRWRAPTVVWAPRVGSRSPCDGSRGVRKA